MKLISIIEAVKDQVVSINAPDKFPNDLDIKGLSLNSRIVKKGDLFFCLSGSIHKGSDFINQAYINGARAVMVDEEIKPKLPKKLVIIRVNDVVKCLGVIADKFYDSPFKRLNSIAVTGTNGKTSITFILERILKRYNKQVGVIGTVDYRFGKKKLTPKNTTPDILTAYSTIDGMLRSSVKYLLMEVSSHALAQRRIEGLGFDQAIFTNLSQDHFDYHKTIKRYFLAKSRLFIDYLKEGGTAIINIDDAYGLRLINLLRKTKKHKIITYGIKKKADIKARDILLRGNVSSFTVKSKKHTFRVNSNLIGLFNIYNCLAAVGSCLALGIPKKFIISGLKSVHVPGRLELIRCKHDIKIFIDYAHTEDALRSILLSLRRLKHEGRLIVVFGCGGNRDRDKRHKMGRVASDIADLVIITSDNPRFEDPKKIIFDIKVGLRNKNNLVIVERRRAIEKAIDIARRGDIIVVAGKGHEGYQIIKDRKFPFNDRAVIKDVLSKRGLIGCLN